jgi:hypothetical protein
MLDHAVTGEKQPSDEFAAFFAAQSMVLLVEQATSTRLWTFLPKICDDTFAFADRHEQQPEDLKGSEPEGQPACVVHFCLTQSGVPNFLLPKCTKSSNRVRGVHNIALTATIKCNPIITFS